MADHKPLATDERARPHLINVEVVFQEDSANGKKSEPIRRGGEELSGSLKIGCNCDCVLDIDIVFEGHVRTWIVHNDSDPFATHARSVAQIKILEQVQTLSSASASVTDCTSDDADHAGGRRVSLPFTFTVPRRLVSARGDVADEFLHLCPSTKIGCSYTVSWKGERFGQPDITYAVRVLRVRASTSPDPVHVWGKHTDVTREVIVLPAVPAPSAWEMAHPHPEQSVQTNVMLRRLRWKTTVGALDIKANEVAPMESYMGCRETTEEQATALEPSTIAYLNFSFTPHDQADAKPPAWTVIVTDIVRSRTFFSTLPMQTSPTQQLAKQKKASMRYTDRKSPPETHDYRLDATCWRQERVLSGATTSCWKAVLPVRVSAPQQSLLPSFLNQLSAREYAVVVRLDIKGMVHRTIELVLPLQVVCRPMDSDHADYGEDALKRVPSYSFSEDPYSGTDDLEFELLREGINPPPYETWTDELLA